MFASVMKAVAILALMAQTAFATLPLLLTEIPQSGVSQCGQITIAWTGGVWPYSLFLMSDLSGPVIKVFPLMLNQYFDWKVSLPEGTQFVVQLQSGADGNGTVQAVTSQQYTVLGSSDRSCINTAIFEYPSPSASRPLPPKPSLTMVPAIPNGASKAPFGSANHTISIVLGVLGGLVAILLVVLGLLFRARRKARADPEMLAGNGVVDDDELDIKKPLPTYAKK